MGGSSSLQPHHAAPPAGIAAVCKLFAFLGQVWVSVLAGAMQSWCSIDCRCCEWPRHEHGVQQSAVWLLHPAGTAGSLLHVRSVCTLCVDVYQFLVQPGNIAATCLSCITMCMLSSVFAVLFVVYFDGSYVRCQQVSVCF